LDLVIPLAGGPVLRAAGVLAVGQALRGASVPVGNINLISLRQAITPDCLQGRVTASFRFLSHRRWR